MGFQSVLFVVTPDELRELIAPFTLFIGNKRMPRDYVSSPVGEFLENYSRIYEKLSAGEMIDPDKDDDLLRYYSLTTDITSLIWRDIVSDGVPYMLFGGTTRGTPPYLAPFTFNTYEENGKLFVSTRGSWMVTYAGEIMGFELIFPKFSRSDSGFFGMESEKDMDSYADYKLFRDAVMKMTFAMKFGQNGFVKRTSIRMSKNAAADVSGFYCLKSRGIRLML